MSQVCFYDENDIKESLPFLYLTKILNPWRVTAELVSKTTVEFRFGLMNRGIAVVSVLPQSFQRTGLVSSSPSYMVTLSLVQLTDSSTSNSLIRSFGGKSGRSWYRSLET